MVQIIHALQINNLIIHLNKKKKERFYYKSQKAHGINNSYV